jgi:hypothetical protein
MAAIFTPFASVIAPYPAPVAAATATAYADADILPERV